MEMNSDTGERKINGLGLAYYCRYGAESLAGCLLLYFCIKKYISLGGVSPENVDDDARHAAQLLMLVSVPLALFVGRALLKLIPKEYIEKQGRKIRTALFRVVAAVSKKIAALIDKLGFNKGRRLTRGTDEYSFAFDERDKEKSRLSIGTVSRLKDLTDNAQKLRFYFIRFMMKKIRQGYRRRRGKTPAEWGNELKLEGDALLFFGDYDKARYSGGRMTVDDKALERAKLVTNGRN